MKDEAITDRESLVVLAVDDDAGEIELLRRILQRIAGLEVEVLGACDRGEAELALRERPVDVVFLDYQLGPESGVDLLTDLRARGDLRPVIALTGRGDEYAAASLIRAGADDYLVKGDVEPGLLRRSIDSARAQFLRRVAEREALRNARRLEHANRKLQASQRRIAEMNRRLRELSNTDALTGIANRRYFMERCEKEFARVLRGGDGLGLVLVDIDFFKAVNDVHGHQAGDHALVAVARVLADVLRQYDLVGRLGGEEFALLLPQTKPPGVVAVAERCRRAVAELRLPLAREPRGVTLSAGVTGFPCKGVTSTDDLIRLADEALYEAKRRGRNRVVERWEVEPARAG